jgi:hypothetical protein
MKALVCILAVSLFASAAENPVVVIVGEISDSQCAFNVHSNVSSHEDVIKAGLGGRNSKQCTQACVRMGGKYVLIDSVHKKVYHLANPEKAAEHAAMRVRVHGFIDQAGAISITEIENH